jgi:hypothetical protein
MVKMGGVSSEFIGRKCLLEKKDEQASSGRGGKESLDQGRRKKSEG